MTEPWPGDRKWGTGSGRPRDRAQGPGRAAASRLACPVPGCPAVLAPVPPTRGPRHGRGKARRTDAEGALLRGVRRGRLPGPASLPGAPVLPPRGRPRLPAAASPSHSDTGAPGPAFRRPGPQPLSPPASPACWGRALAPSLTVPPRATPPPRACDGLYYTPVSATHVRASAPCTPEHTYLTCLYHASEQTYLT